MKRALIAGPCMSEFGWEVMEWQGYVRRQADGCAVVVVCSRPHMAPLYADIPGLIFVPHAIRADVTTHRIDVLHDPAAMDECKSRLDAIARELDTEGYAIARLDVPRSGLRFGDGFAMDGRQVFRRMGRPQPRIVAHIRAKRYTVGGEPNYPPDLWGGIIGRLTTLYGGPVAAVGTASDALCLPGCDDWRDIPLDRLCDLFAAASVAVGPSSGPMHLASLCGCPHVVWTEREATADRYRRGWNPFGTPARALIQDSRAWIDPQAVADAVGEIIGGQTCGVPDGGGVCYACVGEDYCEHLAASVRSLRAFYSGPVAVVTDGECDALEDLAVRYKLQVVTAPVPRAIGQHARSRWIKTSLYRWSPFEATAYLDCDTIICGHIGGIFLAIDADRPMAMTTETGCETLGQRTWQQTTNAERDETISACGADSPHWHSSTMVWRRCASVRDLFCRWHSEWYRYGMADPQGRVQDQPGLARAIARSNMAPKIAPLPKHFNRRSRRDGCGDCFDADTVVYSVRPCGGDFARAQDRLRSLAAARLGIDPSVFGDAPRVPKMPRKMRRRGDKP